METLDRLFWLFIRKCLFVELFGETHFALFFSEFPTVQCPVHGANGVCFYNNLYNCGHKQNRLGFRRQHAHESACSRRFARRWQSLSRYTHRTNASLIVQTQRKLCSTFRTGNFRFPPCFPVTLSRVGPCVCASSSPRLASRHQTQQRTRFSIIIISCSASWLSVSPVITKFMIFFVSLVPPTRSMCAVGNRY